MSKSRVKRKSVSLSKDERKRRGIKYPACQGIFPDCPEELPDKIDDAPRDCQVCPHFKGERR